MGKFQSKEDSLCLFNITEINWTERYVRNSLIESDTYLD